MPRAATTSDVFSAVGEPRRRQIIDLLARGRPRAVGELVDALQLPQPAVSKHLGVLKKVGIVSVRSSGQKRLYELNPAALRPMHAWLQTFERHWMHQLSGIKERAERVAKERRKP